MLSIFKKTKASIVCLIVLSLILISCPKSIIVKTDSQTIVVPTDYPTLVTALSNASNGDTILVKSGTYDGNINETLVISKTISIIGENPWNTIINLYPGYNLTWITMDPFYNHYDSITIEADSVVFQNFTVNIFSSVGLSVNENSSSSAPNTNSIFHVGGDVVVAGNGTKLTNCNINHDTEKNLQPKVFVTGNENQIAGCNINVTGGFIVKGSDNVVEGNNINHALTLEQSSRNSIIGNIISEAIYLEYTNSNFINSNICGGFSMGYYGRICQDNLLSNNIINGDGNSFLICGAYIDAGINCVFHDNQVSNFEVGICLTSNAANNTFYRNNILNNDRNIELNTLAPNLWDNGNEGNYWSNYNGTDNNADGIGDVAYIIDENNRDNYPLMDPVDIETILEFPKLMLIFLLFIASFVAIICNHELKMKSTR